MLDWTRETRQRVFVEFCQLPARQRVFQGALADVMTGIALLNMALSLLLTPLLLRVGFRLEPEVEPHHPPMPTREPVVP